MEQLLIFPYSGNGLEALSCIGDKYELVGFVDDAIEKQGKTSFGPVVYSREAFEKFPNAKVLAVPGSPQSYKIRKQIIDGLNLSEERFASIIHPDASISNLSEIGRNVLIMAGVVLTSNCIIGDHVCILPNTVIHHDSAVGAYSLVGSNVAIAGNTKVGFSCYIGSGTNIINGITIGDYTIVGLGSNVIKSMPENSKVAGNPAKTIG
jgi:sugar O-acyltransferase (sialic acid O-acetyltransferase NeuD family)